MSDLIEFLRARLTEIEAKARGAAPVWRATGLIHPAPTVRDLDSPPPVFEEHEVWRAAHIAHHDPAYVLRDVEANRRIIDCHSPDRDPRDEWHGNDVRCQVCGGYDLVAGLSERGYRTPWPCPTLRLLALPYDQHPDYREEWRP